jgi:hypothetical protein
MDEKLRYFEPTKNAKVRNNWSSWNIWHNHYVSFVVFFVLMLCCWTLFCFLHGCDNARCWSSGILHCFGVGDWWKVNVAIYEGASYIVKLSSCIKVWVFFFLHFFFFDSFKFVCLLGVFPTISSKEEVCEGGMA